jgi:hypothetical protein
MEKPTVTRACLSGVRVIMLIMHVLVVELLCHAVMGWVPVLKCLLSGVCGRLWVCLIVLGIKYHCFPWTRLQRCLSRTKAPGRDCREPRYVLS